MSQSECRSARGWDLSRLVGSRWLDLRVSSRRRHCRQRAGLQPALDQLEVRTLLSNTAAPAELPLPAALLAPVASETTWNLQLQPGGAGALSTLVPAIAAAGSHIGATPVPGLYVVHGPPAAMAALGARLAATPGVAYAEPQRILSIAATPDDPNYTNNNQWQLNGTWGINAPGAWSLAVGSNGVIVADTDTGLNYNLADMNYNVWLNQAEIPSGVKPNLTDVNKDGFITFSDLNNSINQGPGKIVDTNHDGVISGTDVLASTSIGGWASGSTQDGATGNPDDLVGWNYAAAGSNGITGTDNAIDDNGHGTFTASEIAAVGNNALGVTGVEWNSQLMPVKFLDSTGNGSDTAASAAIHYAVDHGAKVINASWGGSGSDAVIQDALQYANQHGVIVVCAAGNSATNDDTSFFAPASYSVQDPNVISVAATGSNGALASFSNYGIKSVQLAAPGVAVYSLESSGGDGTLSGTSMAAPLVTGTIALVWSAHPAWSMRQVIDAVLDHTTPDSNLAGKVTTGGIVNATGAVANTDGPHVVTSTTLGSVETAGGFNGVQVTFNEEVNPSTFTAAQVTLSGPNGAISGFSVSVVSGSNDHQFVISFPGQTTPGTYNLKAGPGIRDWYGNAMNQNRNGVNGESSDAFTTAIQETNTTATLLNNDTTTQGTWIGTYGAQGYDVIGKPASLPSYAAVTPSGAGTATWAASTTDVRALQAPGGASRIAATWYSGSSFTVDVNISDGQAHKLELYFLDWDSSSRAETVQVSDAATNAVLSTRSIASFHNGLYLDYQVSGHIRITITRTGGANAVLSGLFLG
jgi:subtilisin family serine protease